jgi:hypothetical protein
MNEIKSITIKRLRKKNYPMKRDHYKSYVDAEWKWIDVFNEIDDIKLNTGKFYKIIAKKYGIKRDTLKQKYLEWKKIGDINLIEFDNRGKNKYFTDIQEKEIYDELMNNINKLLPTYDDDIKIRAKNKWNKLYPNNEKLKISNGWCYEFKKRWKLSSLRPRPIKCATHECTEEELNNFFIDCTISVNEVGLLFFLI